MTLLRALLFFFFFYQVSRLSLAFSLLIIWEAVMLALKCFFFDYVFQINLSNKWLSDNDSNKGTVLNAYQGKLEGWPCSLGSVKTNYQFNTGAGTVCESNGTAADFFSLQESFCNGSLFFSNFIFCHWKCSPSQSCFEWFWTSFWQHVLCAWCTVALKHIMEQRSSDFEAKWDNSFSD